MPDTIAERLLRLTASREVASTIAGDLRELAITRGKLWFWFAIVRTVSSLLWKDLVSAPLFLAILGLRGLLVTLCLASLLCFIAIGVPFGFATKWDHGVFFTADVAWLTAIALTQFITGRYLAAKARGREIAAVLAYIAVYNVLRVGIVVIQAMLQSSADARSLWHIGTALIAGMPRHGLLDQFAMVMKFAPLFLGAVLVRFRQREFLSPVVRL
jgi:hypothetical protein